MSDTNYSIVLDDELRKQLEADATKNGRTLADHIRFVLRESLKGK